MFQEGGATFAQFDRGSLCDQGGGATFAQFDRGSLCTLVKQEQGLYVQCSGLHELLSGFVGCMSDRGFLHFQPQLSDSGFVQLWV